jgi:hypothetical protein
MLLHTLFLGFVFAMIFGHAPIIPPAVLRISETFSGSFYAPLILLHLSLALRVEGRFARLASSPPLGRAAECAGAAGLYRHFSLGHPPIESHTASNNQTHA